MLSLSIIPKAAVIDAQAAHCAAYLEELHHCASALRFALLITGHDLKRPNVGQQPSNGAFAFRSGVQWAAAACWNLARGEPLADWRREEELDEHQVGNDTERFRTLQITPVFWSNTFI